MKKTPASALLILSFLSTEFFLCCGYTKKTAVLKVCKMDLLYKKDAEGEKNMNRFSWDTLRLTLWQRRFAAGIAVVLAGQFHFSLWAEGFRISMAAVIYAVLLITLMRDSHRPDTGIVTAGCVLIFRMAADLLQGGSLGAALLLEIPGALFYLFYECILCLLVQDRRADFGGKLWISLVFCDFGANVLNFALSSHFLFSPRELWGLGGLALIRATAVWLILLMVREYRALLLRQEHEERYRRLFLMTAELKSELYFLRKNAEDIEAVMSSAYRLYETLPEEETESKTLALGVARDVHEVKKDNLRIIRGLEQVVTESYDGESMAMEDLIQILERSTRQLLGEKRSDIRLECRVDGAVKVREHYQVLSVLKNLVTNAVEAIESESGRGTVSVECRAGENMLTITVKDDGPGISQRGMKHLFQVGYSTKFDPDTGNINRGVGLPAVQHIVENLGGTVEVTSQKGEGTCFCVALPLQAVTGGEA